MIRQVREEDALQAALLALAYAGEPWNEQWTQERALRRVKSILHSDGGMGIAMVEDGEMLGCALGFIDPYAQEDFFYLSELYVHPHKRRQGVDSALLMALKEQLAEMGVGVIQLMAIGENAAFYRKAGFAEDDVQVFFTRKMK